MAAAKPSSSAAAVAFHDDAIQAEKHAAIGLAHVHLLAQALEGAPGEHITDLGQQGAAHRGAQIFADLAGGALGGLQRDVAGKALGHDHVDRAFADVVALDEAAIVERFQIGFAQKEPGLLDLLLALDLLDPDIEQPDRRPLRAEHGSRHGGAENGEVDQLLGIGADRGADIEHHAFAAHGRPQCRNRRPVDIGHGAQAKACAIAISAPVLPADTQTSAWPFLTASIARHIDDFQRPCRKAWLGLSSIRTATSQWENSLASASCGNPARIGRTTSSCPKIRKRTSGRRARTFVKAGRTTLGP